MSPLQVSFVLWWLAQATGSVFPRVGHVYGDGYQAGTAAARLAGMQASISCVSSGLPSSSLEPATPTSAWPLKPQWRHEDYENEEQASPGVYARAHRRAGPCMDSPCGSPSRLPLPRHIAPPAPCGSPARMGYSSPARPSRLLALSMEQAATAGCPSPASLDTPLPAASLNASAAAPACPPDVLGGLGQAGGLDGEGAREAGAHRRLNAREDCTVGVGRLGWTSKPDPDRAWLGALEPELLYGRSPADQGSLKIGDQQHRDAEVAEEDDQELDQTEHVRDSENGEEEDILEDGEEDTILEDSEEDSMQDAGDEDYIPELPAVPSSLLELTRCMQEHGAREEAVLCLEAVARTGNVDELARHIFCLEKVDSGGKPLFERGRDMAAVAARVLAAAGFAGSSAHGTKSEQCSDVAKAVLAQLQAVEEQLQLESGDDDDGPQRANPLDVLWFCLRLSGAVEQDLLHLRDVAAAIAAGKADEVDMVQLLAGMRGGLDGDCSLAVRPPLVLPDVRDGRVLMDITRLVVGSELGLHFASRLAMLRALAHAATSGI